MKVKTTQEALSEGIGIASKGIPSRSINPLFQYLELHASEGKLILTGSDGDLVIKTEVEAEVEEHGTFLVQAKPLRDLIARFPHSGVDLVRNDNVLEVRDGSGALYYKLYGIEDTSFPDIPPYSDKLVVELSAGLLRKGLGLTSFATNRGETSQQFTAGVYFNFEGDRLDLVGTDSHRLSLYEMTLVSPNPPDVSLLVPIAVADYLESMLPEGDEQAVGVYHVDGQVVFTFHHREGLSTWVSSRLIDVKYPDYRRVIPSEAEAVVSIPRVQFMEVLRRVIPFAKYHTQNPVVRIETKDGQLRVSTEAGEVGEGEETIPVAVEGKDVLVAFNPQYMNDCLSALEVERVNLHWRDPSSAMLIDSPEEPNFKYVLMPIRLD